MTIATPVTSLWLDDGMTSYAPTGGGIHTLYGKVGGTPRIIDTGSSVLPWRGVVAFMPTTLDLSSGNEQYLLTVEGSNTADFSGAKQDLVTWNLRALNPQDVMTLINVYDEVVYRYLRLKLTLSGTTPVLQMLSFIRSLGDLSEYTLDQLIQVQVLLSQNNFTAQTNFRAWMTGVAWGGDNNDGKYPLSDGLGNTVYVKCPAQWAAESQIASPFYYGAIGSLGRPWGDRPSVPASNFYDTLSELQAVYPFATSLHQEMDWLGWQAALKAGKSLRVDNRYSWKMVNTHSETWVPLIGTAGLVDIDCGLSEFHWEDFRAISDNTEFVENSNFATSSGWVNASHYNPSDIINATFGSGKAEMIDPSTPVADQGRFYQWGRLVTLNPGYYTVSATVTCSLGQSYGFPPPLNNNQPVYAGIGWFSDGPGQGSNPYGRNAEFAFQSEIFDGVPITQTRSFDIYVETTTTAWMTFGGGGYANFDVTYFGIKRWLPNCAILGTRDGSPHHYPVPCGMRKFLVWGPDKSNTGTIFARWKSFQNTDGNLMIFEDMIVQGFWEQFRFGTGAYLLAFKNCGGGGAYTAIHFESGVFNAGENNRFYGGGFGNCDILVNNEGGSEITFYGASTDYANQMCVENRGKIEWNSVHIEHNVPTDPNKPVFELKDGGNCTLIGGMYLGAGGVNTSPVAPISTNNSRCTFTIIGTELYNFTSAPDGPGKGAVISGPGQLKIVDWMNKGNPNIGPRVLSWAPAMDLLGGAGNFEPISGTPFFAGMGVDPTGIDLIGGVYIFDGDIIDTDTFTSRWDTARLSASLSTDYALNGTRSMKVQKKAPYGVGNGGRLMLFIPAKPEHGVLGEFNAMFPTAVAGAVSGDVATLYYRRFWCQVIGYDVLGRPIVNSKHWAFAGEENFVVKLDGADAGLWQRRSLSTLYNGTGTSDQSRSMASGAPSWTTHLAILLDHESLPALTYYIDGLVANSV